MFKASYISRVGGFLTRPLSLFILLSCCASAFIPVAFSQSATENNNSETIQGIVVNKVTGEPISRALVFSADNRFGALTDGAGRFEFTTSKADELDDHNAMRFLSGGVGYTNLPGLSLILIAKKPGFLPDPEINAHPARAGVNVTISLWPEAIIHGNILTSNNEPAEGLNVQLFKQEVREGAYHWTPASTVRTNSSGEFRFAELRPGAYKVMTQELLDTDPQDLAPNSQLYGFPPVCFPGVPDFASGSTILLTAGQDVQADIPLTRQPYFRVRIPVLNSAATQGLNVAVYAGDHPGPGYSLGYNSQTSWIEGLLPNGMYRVEADSFFPTPAGGVVDIRVAGSAVEGPSLALLPNGVIPVSVHEEFSSEWNGSTSWNMNGHSFKVRGPRAYLQVSLERADDFSQGPLPTLRNPMPGDDSLVIENARPGGYWVQVQSSRGYVQSMTSGNRDLLREPLIVAPGSHAAIEITMRDDAAKIEGTVAGIGASLAGSDVNRTGILDRSRESSNEHGPSAYVLCIPLPDSNSQFQQLAVVGDGTIIGLPVAPGSYRMLAFKHFRQNFPYRDPQAMKAYESRGQVVTLAPGQTEHVELQLIPDE